MSGDLRVLTATSLPSGHTPVLISPCISHATATHTASHHTHCRTSDLQAEYICYGAVCCVSVHVQFAVLWNPEYHGFCVLLIPALIPTHCSTIGSDHLSFSYFPPVFQHTHSVLYFGARCSMVPVCCSFSLYQTALGCMEVGATILVPRHCQSAKCPSRLSAHGCDGAHAQLVVSWAVTVRQRRQRRCAHGLGCSSAAAACAGKCTARR